MSLEKSLSKKIKDMGKSTLIFGLGGILYNALSFILIPIYTNYFEVSDYGILGLILVVGALITSTLGVFTSGLFRSYYDYETDNERKTVISTVFYILFFISISLLSITLPFLDKISIYLFSSSDYEKYILLSIVIALLNSMNTIPFAIFRAQRREFTYISTQIIFFLFGIISIFYFVVIQSHGIYGALEGRFLMSILSIIISYALIFKEVNLSFSFYEFRKILLFSFPLIPTIFCKYIIVSSNRYFLSSYSTLEELGLYNLGVRFGMIITVLVGGPIALVWRPLALSQKNSSDFKNFVSLITTYVFLLSVFVTLLVSILSKEIIQIVSDKEYWEAYKVVPIIALAYLVIIPSYIYSISFDISRKTKFVASYYLVAAILSLSLNFLFVEKYGMFGAAFSLLGSHLCIVLISFIISQKLLYINFESIRLLKLFTVGIFLFVSSTLIEFESLGYSLISKLFLVLTFPLILYFLNFFTSNEIIYVKSKIKAFLPRYSVDI